MAGDWIKMRTDLFTHPKVFKLAEVLGLDELAVVGALFGFWAWADKHSVDGRVDAATSRLIDRTVRVDGLAEALVSIGWLAVDAEGITIPNFAEHNGDSAKERSQKNQRQARWRERKSAGLVDETSDAAASTAPSTREEKRREEKKEPKAKATVRPSPAPGDEGLFPEAWLAYPKRAGNNSRADALKCWQARLKDGESPETMLAGTRRFANFIAATGKTGTEFVMQASRFYGKSMHYREAWPLPVAASPPPAAPSKTLAAIQRLEAMKHGLADSRNHDGTAKAALPWAGSDSGNGLD